MLTTRRRMIALTVGALALTVVGGSAFADSTEEDLTGCLTSRGRLGYVDEGTEPLRACRQNQIEVQWPSAAGHDALAARIAALEAQPAAVPHVYSGPLTTRMIPPGEYGAVKSPCDPGDYALSGTLVIFAEDFNMVSSHLVVDGTTGVHNWALAGVNEGVGDAEIRVAAVCLNATP